MGESLRRLLLEAIPTAVGSWAGLPLTTFSPGLPSWWAVSASCLLPPCFGSLTPGRWCRGCSGVAGAGSFSPTAVWSVLPPKGIAASTFAGGTSSLGVISGGAGCGSTSEIFRSGISEPTSLGRNPVGESSRSGGFPEPTSPL